MISLIPYVRETFRRHLSQKQAVMLVEFDKLKRVRQLLSLDLAPVSNPSLYFRTIKSTKTRFTPSSLRLWAIDSVRIYVPYKSLNGTCRRKVVASMIIWSYL